MKLAINVIENKLMMQSPLTPTFSF